MHPPPPLPTPSSGLTGECALDAVIVGKAVQSRGALSPWGPWTHGPEVGFQTVEGREAAVILNPDRKYILAQTRSHKRKQLQTEQQVGGVKGGRSLQ